LVDFHSQLGFGFKDVLMDMMIPNLGRITRLSLESKGAFHIAGVQSSAASDKVELENKKKKGLHKKKKLNGLTDETQPSTQKKSVNKDDDGIEHLDTWA